MQAMVVAHYFTMGGAGGAFVDYLFVSSVVIRRWEEKYSGCSLSKGSKGMLPS